MFYIMNQVVVLIFAAVSLSVSQTQFNQIGGFNNQDNLKTERFLYFDMELLKEIANNDASGNFVISPLSIKSTLSMILEGATDKSAQELRSALRLGEDKQIIRDQFRDLLEKFKNRRGSGVTLEIANRVFMSHTLTPLQEYEKVLNNYYNSNVSLVNFMIPTIGAETVNSWVQEYTHGRIPVIVTPASFDGQTQILLANAIYFKGIWKKSFDPRSTKARCFYLDNGECYMTPMMDTIDTFKYGEVKDLDAKVLELPYTGDEYSMVILLPNKRNFDQQLVRDIRNSVNTIVENLNETDLLVALPRFKFEYSSDLVPYMRKVGISTIFTPNAALQNMVADVDGGYVTNFIHKATIEVNEQGTEASAASAAAVIPLMGNIKPRFRADHTFLFFIRHIPTRTILFEGRVRQPESIDTSTLTNSQQQLKQPTFLHNVQQLQQQQQQHQQQQQQQQQPQQQQQRQPVHFK